MSNGLAQSLNELAEANAAGLLNDEEYRILRQSAFDRYAVGADACPDVLRSTPRKPQDKPASPARPAQGPPPPKKARLSGLLRRIPFLHKSPSDSSLSTLHPSPKSSSKATFVLQTTCPSLTSSTPTSFDEDSEYEESSQCLRQQITQLDAERNRLLDAFLSLEETARARLQPRNTIEWPPETLGMFTTTTKRLSTHSTNRSFSSCRTSESADGASLRSSKSTSTTGSKSSHLSSTTMSTRTSIRQLSSSSVSLTLPPSTPKRAKSQNNLPLGVLMEIDPDEERRLEVELADIERRREVVLSRFRQRREYLKAKLKGAELREKLMRH